jgi:hypothetical protein
MKARTHCKYFQEWLTSPTSRRSWLRPAPIVVQFREPNNAAEPSAYEGSERWLRLSVQVTARNV